MAAYNAGMDLQGSNALDGPRRFGTTHWSIVLAAQSPDLPESREALEDLCRSYWYPLYAYMRRRGHAAHEAQDLTQEFFATLLEKNYLESADRERGRFRTFLLTAVSRFLSKQHDRSRAAKRGGGKKPLAIDVSSGEERYRCEPADRWTPERLFERRWALTLLETVLARLAERYAAEGKADLFERLRDSITSDGGVSYAQTAASLGMTEGAVKVAVHRLRRRYRDTLREEIAATVESPGDVDDELNRLFEALGTAENKV
ncbi:MAG TPA: sigma-70 family RNA polymerase sigma factor [Pirellulales bacterium]|nr:sigma-70 family RNA polymerase sigma factor [Pirellulales bacterium]